MTDVVADSSVIAKWVMPEADSPQAKQLLATLFDRGDVIFAVDLAYPEVANAIWKQHLRGQANLDDARGYVDGLLELDLILKPATQLLTKGWEIAAQYRIAVYDALFVALCAELDSSGITADEPLHRAVGKDFPKIRLLRDWP